METKMVETEDSIRGVLGRGSRRSSSVRLLILHVLLHSSQYLVILYKVRKAEFHHKEIKTVFFGRSEAAL